MIKDFGGGDIKKILVVNLGGIGDVVLSTPALRALKNHYGHALFYMLVVPRVYELAKDLPYIDQVVIFHLACTPQEIVRNLKTVILLKKMHFDVAINMRTLSSPASALKMKLLLDAVQPRIKVGRDTEGRGSFLDIKIPETDVGDKLEMEYDIDTVKALGVKVTDKSADFFIPADSAKKVMEILKEEGVGDRDLLIGLHVGGKPSHRWPLENFSKVIEGLHPIVHVKFVITGEKRDALLVDRFFRFSKARIINLAGELTIKELGALLQRCNLYISNDTAAMHIAAILKTPLVAIFGPGFLARFDPRNLSSKTIVIHHQIDCAPCNKVRCKSLKCLTAISVDEVIDAALRLLKND